MFSSQNVPVNLSYRKHIIYLGMASFVVFSLSPSMNTTPLLYSQKITSLFNVIDMCYSLNIIDCVNQIIVNHGS